MNKLCFAIILLLLLNIQLQAKEAPKIKVLVNNLENVSGENNRIGANITSSITLRLSLEENIQIIEDQLNKEQEISYRSKYQQKEAGREEPEYIISGNYQLIDGYISLSLVIYNVVNRKSSYITPKPFNSRDLFSSLEPITQDIVNFIYSNATLSDAKKTGVLCFTALNNDFDNDSFINELRFSVYYNLPQEYTPLQIALTNKYCAQTNFDQIAQNLNADLLIVADVNLSKGELIIYPKIYIAELSKEFSPIPYSTHYKSLSSINVNSFSNYINKVLTSIVDEDGSWNLGIFNTQSDAKFNVLIRELEHRFEVDSLNNYSSISLVDQAMKLKPDRPESYFYYGVILQKQKNTRGAIENFDLAIEKNPRFKEAQVQKGMLLMDYGQYSQALNTFKNVDARPSDKVTNYYTGVSYYFLDSLDQCIDYLEKVNPYEEKQSEIDYYLRTSYFNLGYQYFSDKKFDEAESYLSKALSLTKNSYDITTLLISTYNRLGEYKKGRDLIQLSIENGLLDNSFYIDNAEDLRGIRNSENKYSVPSLKQAIVSLKTYLKLVEQPDYNAYRLLGSCNFRLGDLDSATIYYQHALDVEPNYIGNHLNLAETAIMNQQYEIAESALKKSLNLEFEDSRSRGFEVLIHYLFFVSHILDGKEYKSDLSKIDSLINDKRGKYLDWSFDTFLKWIKASEIDEATTEKVIATTEKLKNINYK